MKIRLLYITILLLLTRFGYSQTYFNYSYNFDLPNVIFTNVIVENDNIYTIGPVVNTSAPSDNSLLVAYDLEGKVLYSHVLEHNQNVCDIWKKESFKTDGVFYAPALLYDTIQKAGLVRFDEFGLVDSIISFANPTYPNEDFVASPHLTKMSNLDVILSYGYQDYSDNIGHIVLKKISDFKVIKTIDIKSNYSKALLASSVDKEENVFLGFANLFLLTKDFIYQNVIQKRDTALNLIWEYKTPLNELLGRVGAIALTNDNGVVVSTMEGKEVFVNPNVNTYVVKNIIFYKLNKDGQKVWETELVRNQSSSSRFISNMRELENGDILASGHFYEGESVQGTIIKLSSEGDSLWQRYYTFPGKNDHVVHDMDILPDGSILLAGESRSPQEGWLIAVDSMGCLIPDCVTSTSELVQDNLPLLRIYPNPVDNSLNIQFRSNRNSSDGRFRIFSASGQLMKEWENGHQDHFIILDVQGFASGQYVLQYEAQGQVISEVFVKR